MGKTIIGSMKETFNPAKYHDEYRERLWEIIQAKANHQEIITAPDEQPSNVLNMMDALQQMLAQAKENSAVPKTRSRKRTTA